ncbi:MAG: hypothetical protein M5T61_19645, partial [Acidimicrobiia bacterium]|nr:hypothetical protein [Acidimicrobiia bacterium]
MSVYVQYMVPVLVEVDLDRKAVSDVYVLDEEIGHRPTEVLSVEQGDVRAEDARRAVELCETEEWPAWRFGLERPSGGCRPLARRAVPGGRSSLQRLAASDRGRLMTSDDNPSSWAVDARPAHAQLHRHQYWTVSERLLAAAPGHQTISNETTSVSAS